MSKRFKKIVGTMLLFCLIFVLGINLFSVEEIDAISDTDPDWNKTSARMYLYYKKSGSFGGVEQKNAIHVFAFEGDTICLGTNIYNSSIDLKGTGDRKDASGKVDHTDKDSIDIVMYDLSGEAKAIDIEGTPGSPGYINNYETEQLAKTMDSPSGKSDGTNTYKPYTYFVSETGVYTFEFRSYDGGANNTNKSNDNNKTTGWPESGTVSNNSAMVAAWDITVFNEDGEKETGRTYADALPYQTTGEVKEKYYILTNDSYIYEMALLGISPYTFSFFSNNRGITDASNGNIIYKSVKDHRNTNFFNKFGINFMNPSTSDTDLNKNFYIFFEKPNPDLEGYLYEKAMLPDPATNLKYIKDENNYAGMGGYFQFDVQGATTATLRIEFNIKDEKYEPVEISDVVTPYTTSRFYWDGKDGKGVTIPAGDYSYEEIKYTVTTKAGEIHFPMIDVESMNSGVRIQRISPIYDKNNVQQDTPNTIYDKTRGVVYYDDTAIYYGEKLTPNGASEKDVTYERNVSINGKSTTIHQPVPHMQDANNVDIMAYRNIAYKNNNEYKLYTTYGAKNGLRVGDHSYTNNKIDYNASYESQQDKINYLDSIAYPVGMSTTSSVYTDGQSPYLHGTGGNYQSTSDYGIINYFTFVPSKSATAESPENIVIKEDDGRFNLVAKVFYDSKTGKTGLYNPQTDGDHLLSDVTLRLYIKSDDNNPVSGKTYVLATETSGTIKLTNTTSFTSNENIYELVSEAKTPLQGTYQFNGLKYDKTNGTEYIYQVVKPNTSYQLTSSTKKASDNITAENSSLVRCKDTACTATTTEVIKNSYGPYMSYAYDPNAYGTEVQKIKVGGTGINVESQFNKTISTIDVGYRYDSPKTSLQIKKNWSSNDGNPETVIYEVSYNNGSRTQVYDMRALAATVSWSNSYEYLESKINGLGVSDYYVSAEYYISGDKIFRHKFEYNILSHTYRSFVGDNSYFSLSDYFTSVGKAKKETYSIEDIPDFNQDGKGDIKDLSYIPESSSSTPNGWKTALPAGTGTSGDVVAPFNAVLDRNIGSAVTEISITNAKVPGTIEILKYTGDLRDNQFLDGATFRIYKGNKTEVKQVIDEYNTAQDALNNAKEGDNLDELKTNFNEAAKKLNDIQIDSGTTRANGRIAFAALDPKATYTVRERFSPPGYRILEEYYEVGPQSSSSSYKFDSDNYSLVQVGNAPATGNLEIRKMIEGRAWRKSDNFTFDIAFNYSSDNKTAISIEKTELTLYGKNFEKEVQTFVDSFNSNGNDFTINYSSEYASNGSSKSADTKFYNELLINGDATSSPSLIKTAFPAAGTYTFTIRENPTSDDDTLSTSTRIFTITVNVKRVLDNEELEVQPTIDNSHLEASISKIEYQEDSSSEILVYAGSTPTFINTYDVEDYRQKVSYKVETVLKGRPDDMWLDTDSFTYIIDGEDETTLEALLNNNIILGGDLLPVDGSETARQLTVTKNTANHTFKFDYIEFDNIHFPVSYDEGSSEPTTHPVIYNLTLKQINPDTNPYKGLTYSTDVFKLKVTLKNAVDNGSGEVDGIIDEIILDLYKNDELISTCTIFQEVDEKTGEVHVEEEHGKVHTMTFNNVYKATSATWNPTVLKTLNGRNWVANDSFSFTLSTTDKTNGATMPKTTTIDITNKDTKVNDTTYSKGFGAITFTKAGTYKFTIKETFTEKNNIKIETTLFETDVEIIDNNEGELWVRFNGDIATPVINFVNNYTEEGMFSLAISKTLKGRKWSTKDDFVFKITPNAKALADIKNKTLIMPANLGTLIDGYYLVHVNGSADVEKTIKELGGVQIKKADDDTVKYQFTIEEQLDDKKFENVDKEINLDVNVSRKLDSDNIPTGELDVVATYAYTSSSKDKVNIPNTGDALKINLPFTNLAYVDDEFTITDNLKGRAFKEGEQFEVEVKLDKEDNVKYLKDGSYSKLVFDKNGSETLKFRFYEKGTYTFTIKQVIPDVVRSGLEMDTMVYTVVFTVTDNDGSLAVSKVIKGNNEAKSSVSFTNVYTTGSLEIKNTVLASKKDLDKEFTFEITLSDDSLNKEFDGVLFENGKAIVKINGNETLTINDIPFGVDYKVEEVEANEDDFVTTSTNETGSIEKNKTSVCEFINTKEFTLAVSGGDISFWIMMKIVIVIESILGLYLIRRYLNYKSRRKVKISH